MRFKPLLLKIETGQSLSDKQEKDLASKLRLYKSFLRITWEVILTVAIIGLFIYALFGSLEPLDLTITVAIIIALVSLIVFEAFVLKYKRLYKYLDAVDAFYEDAFKQFRNYDLFYIGQHKNPHVKALRSKKIYMLTDGYHFVFVEDYFKDTKYKLPKVYIRNEDLFLRNIDEASVKNEIVTARIDDVESFYLTDKPLKDRQTKPIKKFEEYYYNFFDQNKYMTDKSFTILSLKNGITMRLSYTAYEAFVKYMPHKERQ